MSGHPKLPARDISECAGFCAGVCTCTMSHTPEAYKARARMIEAAPSTPNHYTPSAPWGPAEELDSGRMMPPMFRHICGPAPFDDCGCMDDYTDYLADGGWAE